MAMDIRALGHLIEGTVEQDPVTDEYVIRTTDQLGNPTTFRTQEALKALLGQEVRFTLASFANLEKAKQMVEQAQAAAEQDGSN